MNALGFSVIAFLSTIIGGLFTIKCRGKLRYVLGFSSGILLGVVAFDVLPEIFEMSAAGVVDVMYPMVAMVAGFLGFHVIERLILVHHSHECDYAEHHHPDVGVFSSLALIGHSMMDGVAIGLGFQVSNGVGLVVAIAIISHDFCDGLNTAALMLSNGNSLKKSFIMLVLDALAPIAGAASTMLFTLPQAALATYLGAFAGFLLYIGAADTLPEAHSNSTPRQSVIVTSLTCFGAMVAFILVRAAGC